MKAKKAKKLKYEKALAKLQVELVKLQEWIKSKGLRVVVIFEGRDAAGDAVTALAAAMGVWCVRVHEVRGSRDAVLVARAWREQP